MISQQIHSLIRFSTDEQELLVLEFRINFLDSSGKLTLLEDTSKIKKKTKVKE